MRAKTRIRVSITRGLARAWWWLRQVSGDAAYDNYLRHAARDVGATLRRPVRGRAGTRRRETAPTRCVGAAHEQIPHVTTREEFYLDWLRRRYSGVSRCC